MRTLTAAEARRVAIGSQLLAGPRPGSILEVAERLVRIQVDPTSIVARAERLTLWSRLGAYDLDELRRLLEEERALFEYRAFLLPTADLALHRPAMLRHPDLRYARGRYIRQWLGDNAGFRAYVLDELRRRGALPGSQLDDRAEVPWRTGGWNDGQNLARMLEFLLAQGEVAISRRDGNERVWDLAERLVPEVDELPDELVAVERLDRSLRAKGIVRAPFLRSLAIDLPAAEPALESLLADEIAVPVGVDGIAGEWLAHADALAALEEGPWVGRTALLGPFDPLIADRERTDALFGMTYAFELYVRAAKRRYGPYALVALHDDQLVGRIDARMERRAGTFTVRAWFPEPGAAAARAWSSVRRELAALGDWLGARSINLPGRG